MPYGEPLVGSIIFGDGKPSAEQVQIVVAGVAAPPRTPTSEVELRITAPRNGSKIVQMGIWNSDDYTACSAAGFRPFDSNVPWTLAPGSGKRTVHVWLRDEKGRDSEAPVVAEVTVDPKSGIVAVKGNPKFDQDGMVDLLVQANAAEM